MTSGPDTLFDRGGEMAARMASLDWAATPLGPSHQWSQSLRAVVRVMLTSRFAMWMAWGPELTFFYNDAYKPTLGVKEAWALGASSRTVWKEIWPDIGPRIDRVLQNGEATWDEALLLFLERSGYSEETYHTFSYSPLSDDAGQIAGMLCVVTEETDRVIGERRMAALRDLAAELPASNSEADVFDTTRRCLVHTSHDLPFALVYLASEDGKSARLACLHGVSDDSNAAPQNIDLTSPDAIWPIAKVMDRREPIVVDDVSERFTGLSSGPWPKAPRQAILLPLGQPSPSKLAGVLIAGINPFRPLGAAYLSFVGLFAGQLSAGISNARAYEVERQRAAALLEIDRAKTTFFSNISHEFRTPLTLMLGPLLDTLAQQNGPLPPQVAHELTMVHRNGLRLLKLVNMLLEFSRIEAGRVKASYSATDLAAFTAELASIFRSAVEKAGLTLSIESSPLPEPAYVDRDMWEKIVLNLISNAFKFTLTGGIRVRLDGDGASIRLIVKDTGSGIPAQEIPRLFERFHRVEGIQGRTHEGTGIGLALVHELVKLHGGTVSVDSAVGEGTTFTVSIPAGKDHLPADRISEGKSRSALPGGLNPFVEEALRWLPDAARLPEQSQLVTDTDGVASSGNDSTNPRTSTKTSSNGDRGRIILADDNADMRDYLTRLLSETYDVVAVSDGQQALTAARAACPSLILSDVMMPNLDGMGLLRAIRSDAILAKVPLILLSARAGEEATLDAIKAGADDYILKPFSARELIARVDSQVERKHFERQLAATELRLNAAMAAAKMAAWEWDPVTDIATVSATTAEVYGLTPEQALDSSSFGFSLVHPDDVQRHQPIVVNAALRRESYRSEFRIIRPRDGKIAWMEERGQIVIDPVTNKTHMVGLTMDVTERKETEIALKRSEERARFIVTLDDALRMISDPDDMSHTAAEVLAQHIGVDRAIYVEVDADQDHCQVTGEYSPVLQRIAGAYCISEYGNEYSAAMRSNRPYIETDATRLTLTPLEREQFAALNIGAFVAAPLFKNNRLAAIFIVHSAVPRKWQPHEEKDIAIVASRCWESIERARISRALAASEERLAFSIEAAELGTFYCPMPMGNIVWNQKCKEHFWLPHDAQVDFDRFYAILHDEDRDRTRETIERVLRDRQPYDIEYRTVSPDGRVRWVRAKGRAYYDNDGSPTRFDGITLDVTDSKLLEERRDHALTAERTAREEAERVSRMKDEFLATLSHELRTPLNAILGWAQILNRDPDQSTENREGLEVIERNARAQTQMIEDLLDMSRIISGKVRLDVQRLVLSDVVSAAVQSVRPSSEVKGIKLLTVIDPYAGPIAGDTNRLQQVIWNLLTNAIKFTPRGGTIQLILQRVNSHLELSVSDSGEGIAPEFLPHVFERFRQADASTTRRHGGLGLGLNIVKQLIELHGGTVRVESAGLGKGSTFTITFPLALAEMTSPQPSEPRQHPRASSNSPGRVEFADLNGITILVVDDDKDARTVIKRILSEGGANVLTAGSVAEAMEMLPRSRPQLLISDIGMPVEDGFDMIRKVRQLSIDNGGATPAVALTAFARSEDRQRAMRAGYQLHVAKPVEPSELLTVCASLAGRIR